MDYKIDTLIHQYIYNDILTVANGDINWDKLRNKTILITGAGGFIGYYLTMAMLIRNDLYGDNIKVLALVRNKEKTEKRFGDALNRDDIKIIVQDVCSDINIEDKADYVIHAASQASAYFFENDPVGTIDANLTGTYKVLDYAKRCDAVTLFVSSLKVYGALHTGKDKIEETDIGYIDHTDFKNCYAQGKRASETLCASFNKQYGMSIKIARPSYIYGPSSLTDDRVWAQFIANIVKHQSILLKSAGAPYRSFCYVTDTATALLKIMLDGKDIYPYNISAEHSNVTIRNFARKAVEAFPERNLTLSFANKEDEKEPVLSVMGATPEILDSTRLNNIGWQAKVDLTEGIKRAVKIVELQNS
ncbi:MAG: NAD-dependent epimerase/dehydratase family protein [Acutalibacteraceae bacterium]|nr:NAD-dependent epimerase/dehydratase family protein [Acutalibacteraceae bacterium]